jgi:transposase
MVGVKIEEDEAKYLREFVKKGRKSAREITRARILLMANQQKGDTEIAEILGVGRNTVWRTLKRYREEGIQGVMKEKPRSGQPKKYSKRHEAKIIAQACTKPSEGRKRWSLTLLAEELRKKEGFETLNPSFTLYNTFS